LALAVNCGPSSTRHEAAPTAGAGSGGAGASGTSGAGAGGATSGAGGQIQAGEGGDLPTAGEDSGGTGGTDVPCSSDPAEITGLSFTVDLARGSTLCCGEIPGPTVFHFEQTAGGLEVVIGSKGQASRGSVTPAGSRLEVESGLMIRDAGAPYIWSMHNGVSVEKLSLCFHPARDSALHLDGRGKLLVVRNGDDYEDQYEASVDFAGAPWDDTPPTLPASQTIDPLEPAAIAVSEPLALGARAALDDTEQTPLDTVEQAGTVVAFSLTTILPLGFEAHVGTDARDLSGNRLKPDCVLQTDADPGVQTLDGFESELRVVNYGDYPATLVTGSRALEGSHSLEVPGGGVALMHLVRPTIGAKHVRFDLKPDPRLYDVQASFWVRAGVVNGSEIVTRELPIPYPLPSDAAGAAGAGGSGAPALDVTAVDLTLSESGADILLEITAPFIELSASTDVGAIVDRLRIE
jgi:hypothetical protein